MPNQIANNEITDSVKKNFKNRLTSPVYGTFFVWWLVFHWELVYTMFFIDEDKVWSVKQMLMNDYIRDRYFHFDWLFIGFWAAPFVMTFITIWWFPKFILIPLFRRHERYEAEKRRIRLGEETKIEEEILKKLKVVSEKVEEEKKIEEADPSINWEQEYLQFRKSDFFENFKVLINVVYSNNPYVHSVPKDVLAYSDSIGLIDIKGGTITFTDKGKYFVKQYSLHNKIIR